MKCACCERSNSSVTIDYHHWDYESDVGVYLCRECHNYIHDGKRAREQTKQLPYGESWKIPTINRLVGLHESKFGRAESWDAFFSRYNIPDKEPFLCVCELEL